VTIDAARRLHAAVEHERVAIAERQVEYDAEQERKVEAELAAYREAQAEADKRGPLVGVESSYPGGDKEWAQ
jgi:hypothetical protein